MIAPDVEALVGRLEAHAKRFPASAQDDGITEAAVALREQQAELERLRIQFADDYSAEAIRTLRRERDALQARVRALEDYKIWWERDSTALARTLNEVSSLRAQNEQKRAQLVSLRAENEKLRKDAERWRLYNEIYIKSAPEAWDAAVDAAMAAGKKT